MPIADKLKIAYISPFNPLQSGISDYSETLVPLLSEFFDLTLYSDCGVPSNPMIANRFQVYPVQYLHAHRSSYDLRLYQIGNSPHHRSAFAALRCLPGVVVLHEPFLHHGLYWSSPLHFYRRELFYDLGRPDQARLKQLEHLLLNDDRQQMINIPLIGRILDSSPGIVVHSRTARKVIETYWANSHRQSALPEIRVIPQLMAMPGPYDTKECRARFGLPPDAFVVGMGGVIHPVKEPRLVLQAFARLAVDLPEARLLFVGEVYQETGDILEQVGELGIAERATILGRVEALECLHQAMAACDMIVNLRRTTIGETSAVALRAMALGKPVVVRDIGWFSELPDDVCVKIGPEDSAEKLAAVMRALAASPEMRLRIGREAQRYVQRECDPSQIARQYAEFLWDIYWNTVGPELRG
jgi:glycosyltransferase involved in cell wall biosynthesis